jgi:hypothetical protein
MESSIKPVLLDRFGKPLPDRIRHLLGELTPRFRRKFSVIRDEVVLIKILEHAGRKTDGSGLATNEFNQVTAFTARREIDLVRDVPAWMVVLRRESHSNLRDSDQDTYSFPNSVKDREPGSA